MDNKLLKIIYRAVALGVSVGTLILNTMDKIHIKSAISLLAIAIIGLAMAELQGK